MKTVLIAVAAALSVASPIAGTTLERKNLGQLSAEAEAIVVARVLSNACAWDAPRRLIWTETTLLVTESWKGSLTGRVLVKEPGGEVPPVGQRVPGMARYRPGDTVVVFLKKDVLGQWRTHGCIQGMFRVVRKDGRRFPAQAAGMRHVVAGFVGRDMDLVGFRRRVLGLSRKGSPK